MMCFTLPHRAADITWNSSPNICSFTYILYAFIHIYLTYIFIHIAKEYTKLIESPSFGKRDDDVMAPPPSTSKEPLTTSSLSSSTYKEPSSTSKEPSLPNSLPPSISSQPPSTAFNNGLKLRDYQLEGVNWLLWNWWNKRSCILADEMGLGKTIQSTCFLQLLKNMKSTQVRGPFLLVAPLSLINQWQNEVEIWAPEFNCLVYHGNTESKDIIQQYEFYYQEPFVSKNKIMELKRYGKFEKFDFLLTTYETIIKDIKVLSKINWKVMVIDEAHKLKNPTSRLFEHLCTIPYQFCVLLTGTSCLYLYIYMYIYMYKYIYM
jgi:SNF2 family DNA or RNA helicase